VCRELIFSQTEDYVEYSRHGKVLKGEEQTTIRSRYEEDVFNNNHTAVWGSWWQGGRWGYKCCHSTMKNSYCTGTPILQFSARRLCALVAVAARFSFFNLRSTAFYAMYCM
jgi:hypothetical protein